MPNPGNPVDLNRYAYVRNNPLIYVDPSGHEGIPEWLQKSYNALNRASANYGNWLDRASAGLGTRLDVTSENLAHLLDCAAGGSCEESGYRPNAATQQAMGIISDWFYETGDEVQYFRAEDPLTQELMYDRGLEKFREEWAAAGHPMPWEYDYSIDETGGKGGVAWAFVRAQFEFGVSIVGLGSMTPEGHNDMVGGTLGSYQVRVTEDGFAMAGSAEITVYNETGWASGTRIPGIGSLIANRPRSAWGPGGTIQQYFTWYEPIPSTTDP